LALHKYYKSLYSSQGPYGLVLIFGLQGRQPTGDVSHKPGSRLLLLSPRPAVTFPALEHHCRWPVPISTTWQTETRE